MKVLAVVLAAVLVGAVAAQAGNYSAGFFLGHRTVNVATYSSSFAPGILELGGHFTWQMMEHVALRGSFAYNTGSFTQKRVITYVIPPEVETYETKHSYSGFPIEFNVLPTFKIGEKLILRAGGGLAYHSYADKTTFKYTSPSNAITTTEYPSAKTSGFGSQFLLCSEGKISNNMGVEIQYKKDAGSFNYSQPRYTHNSNESYEDKVTFGGGSDTYRLGMTFAF